MNRITLAPSPQALYRISFTNSATELPPASVLAAKPPGRYDDPERHFRSLYLSTSKVGAYLETLQDLRLDLEASAALEGVLKNDRGYAMTQREPNVIRAPWILERYAGIVMPDRPLQLVDVSDQRTIDALREPMAELALRSSLKDISASSFMGPERAFTTGVARALFLMKEHYDGIAFKSALGEPFANVALFEDRGRPGSLRAPVTQSSAERVHRQDPALQEALDRFNLSLSGADDLDRDMQRENDLALERDEDIDMAH